MKKKLKKHPASTKCTLKKGYVYESENQSSIIVKVEELNMDNNTLVNIVKNLDKQLTVGWDSAMG